MANLRDEAYILVTMDKPVEARACTSLDLSNNFIIQVNGVTVTPISVSVTDSREPNKVLIHLKNTDVPKTTWVLAVAYNDGDTTGNTCNLFQSGTQFLITPSVRNFDLNSSANAPEVKTTQMEQKPGLIGTLPIVAPNNQGGKTIFLTYTSGRDISNTFLQDGSGQWTIDVTADPSGTFPQGTTTYPGIPQKMSLNYNDPDFNIIRFDASSGQIQRDSSYTVTYEGDAVSDVHWSVRDQFDLSAVSFTPKTGINDVVGADFYEAYAKTTSPYCVFAVFKNHTTGVPIDVSDNIGWPVTIPTENYQIRWESWQGMADAEFDVSRVEAVNYHGPNIAGETIDVSAVKLSFSNMPLLPNRAPGSETALYWNSNAVPENDRIKDKYGNDVRNSEWDPLAGEGPVTWDPESVTISNTIKGIEIYKNSTLIKTQTPEGGSTWDPSINAIIKIRREGSTVAERQPEYSGNDVSINSVPSTQPIDFTIWNVTTDVSFNPDGFKITDASELEIWIDYSDNDYTKVINKEDDVRIFYTPGGTHSSHVEPWPTTIKDEYGNYLVDTKMWVGVADASYIEHPAEWETGYQINNKIEFSGNIVKAWIYGSGQQASKLYVQYDIDLCENLVSDIGYDVSFSKPSDPSSVISSVEDYDISTILINLSRPVWWNADFHALFYDNAGTTGIRNIRGLKLHDEDFEVDITGILAPGDTNKHIFTRWEYSGVMIKDYDRINFAVDPSINVSTPTSHGSTAGFSYKAIYNKYSDVSDATLSRDWTDVPEGNVFLQEDGLIISIDTSFNIGDETNGVCGFSKLHTRGARTDHSENYIQIKYEIPPGTDGLLSIQGPLRVITDASNLKMADASNLILDISVNSSGTGINYSSLGQYDISSIMIFDDIPNFVFCRVQQKDLSGSELVHGSGHTTLTGGIAGMEDTPSKRVWYDVSRIDLSGIVGTKNFHLEYSGVTVNITDISLVNSKIWDNIVSGWGVYPPGDLAYHRPYAIGNLDSDSNAINARWIGLKCDRDFSNNPGDPSGLSYSLDLSYNFDSPGEGIFGQNGSMLVPFITQDISCGTLWTDMSFSRGPFVDPSNARTVWFRARHPDTGPDEPYPPYEISGITTAGIYWATGTKATDFQLHNNNVSSPGTNVPPGDPGAGSNRGFHASYFWPGGNIPIEDCWMRLIWGSGVWPSLTADDYIVDNSSQNAGKLTYRKPIGAAGMRLGVPPPPSTFYDWTSQGMWPGTAWIRDWSGDNPVVGPHCNIVNRLQLSMINSVTVDTKSSNKLLFTTNGMLITVPMAYNVLNWNIDISDNEYGTSTCLFGPSSNIQLYPNPTDICSTQFTIDASEGEFQFGTTGGEDVSYNNTSDTGGKRQNGYKYQDNFPLESSGNITIQNNVKTPYYPDISFSRALISNPNQINVWFENSPGNSVDLSDNTDALDKNYFKIITKNKLNDVSYNILDISTVSIINIPNSVTGTGDISGILIDLSRNIDIDLSNVNNPWTFSEHDEIYLWWDSLNVNDEAKLQDIYGNKLFDASAQQHSTDTAGVGPDVSGAVDASSTRDITTNPFPGGISMPTFYGLEISNNIIDLSGLTGRVKGFLGEDPSNNQVIIEFNTDYYLSDLEPSEKALPSDFVLEISSVGGSWEIMPDTSWNLAADIGYTIVSYIDISMANGSSGNPWLGPVLVDTDAFRISYTGPGLGGGKLKNAITDVSGNILRPTGLNKLNLLNHLSPPGP